MRPPRAAAAKPPGPGVCWRACSPGLAAQPGAQTTGRSVTGRQDVTELVERRTGELIRPIADQVRDESRRIVDLIREGISMDGVRQLADRAEALRLLAKKAGIGLEAQNEAAYARIICEREGGRILREMGFGQHGGDRRSRDIMSLENIKVERHQSKRWQRVERLPEPLFEAYARRIREKPDELTSAGVRAEVSRLEHGKGVVQSLTNEWYTPAIYLDAARTVLGGIDLDPASCAEANETVEAARFFTEDDDSLYSDWHGRVWLNPPYGRIAGDFVARLVDQHQVGNVTAAVALVNAHCTDTSWFQALWDHLLCFTDHRINFLNGTEERSGSTHGSVFAYLGPDPGSFKAEFARFGAVVCRA